MKLESGTYELWNLVWTSFIVWENQEVVFLDNWDLSWGLDFELQENSKLEYFGIYKNNGDYWAKFSQIWNGSHTNIAILNLIKNNELDLNIHATIFANNCLSRINILSICNDWNIKINSGVRIENKTNWWSWEVHQENIFTWEKGKIIWIPGLDINTSNANARHSLKIEKINPEELFYLESRWIDKQNATHIMLGSKINNLFSSISLEYRDFYENELEQFLSKK